MIPKPFDYFSPGSLDEAIRFLGENEDAKLLAGGQSLLPLMKLRLAAPSALVDISKLQGLSYVREEGDHLSVGALTTHDALERDPLIRGRFGLIADAVERIGDQQVRNRGTIGGSACHGDPASDLPTALLALGARFVLQGRTGRRVVEAKDFFVDYFTTAAARDEILTEVRLPLLPPRAGSAFAKHSLRGADFAIAMVGTVVELGRGTTCLEARMAVGAAGPTPIRASSAEACLRGRELTQGAISEAAGRATEGAAPSSDVHGSADYRLAMIKVLARRSLELAMSRAVG